MPEHIVLPKELTGVDDRIMAVFGNRFPTAGTSLWFREGLDSMDREFGADAKVSRVRARHEGRLGGGTH